MLRNHKLLNTPGRNMNQKNCKKKKKKEKHIIAITEYSPRGRYRSLVGTVHGITKNWTRLSDFTFTFTHLRRKWQPTPVFLPGESQGRGSLVGCRLWGRTVLATTEVT